MFIFSGVDVQSVYIFIINRTISFPPPIILAILARTKGNTMIWHNSMKRNEILFWITDGIIVQGNDHMVRFIDSIFLYELRRFNLRSVCNASVYICTVLLTCIRATKCVIIYHYCFTGCETLWVVPTWQWKVESGRWVWVWQGVGAMKLGKIWWLILCFLFFLLSDVMPGSVIKLLKKIHLEIQPLSWTPDTRGLAA